MIITIFINALSHPVEIALKWESVRFIKIETAVMADFYRNASALFDEFKKRELRYLHIERNSYNTLSWKNETSRSTEDQLKRITKRERETEKTYRDIMRNIEVLDKHTDQMSLKLEKLNVLRNIAISSYNSSWPKDTFDRTAHSYLSNVYPSALHSNVSASAFPQSVYEHTQNKFSNATSKDNYSNVQYPVSHLEKQLLNPDYHSKEVQTEHIFCEQCHYPFTLRSNVYNVHSSPQPSILNVTNNVESVRNKEAPTSHYDNTRLEDPAPISTIYEGSKELQPCAAEENSNLYNEPPVCEKNLQLSEDMVVHTAINRKEFASDATANKEVVDSVKGNEEEQYVDIKDGTSVSCGSHENAIVSKSDDESINHEFDFLESDKMCNSKRKASQPVVQLPSSHPVMKTLGCDQENEKVLLKTIPHSIEAPPIDASMHLQISQSSGKDLTKNLERNESIKSASDIKSVSSVSADYPSHLHFENTSIASESDSFSDKETPLTATAAYQAMLGNVSSAKVIEKRQEITDSESEDEIENALATTVRKSSGISLNATTSHVQKIEEEREKAPEAKPKKETKNQAAIFPGKPQNKLTKKTRKVLGLETSSGSEMELEVKAAPNQKDEDSDEFDFYD